MSKSILNAAVAKIAAELESRLEVAIEYIGHADRVVVSAALGTLTGAVNDALDALQALARNPEAVADAVAADRMDVLRDALAASLPPISGGSPDDHEEVCGEFLADPAGWPAYPHDESDGYVYELGPTPLDVLACDEFEAERTDEDWDAYFSLSVENLSDLDHMVVHGCC